MLLPLFRPPLLLQERPEGAATVLGLTDRIDLFIPTLTNGSNTGPFATVAVLAYDITLHRLDGQSMAINVDESSDQLQWDLVSSYTFFQNTAWFSGTAICHKSWTRMTAVFDSPTSFAAVTVRISSK